VLRDNCCWRSIAPKRRAARSQSNQAAVEVIVEVRDAPGEAAQAFKILGISVGQAVGLHRGSRPRGDARTNSWTHFDPYLIAQQCWYPPLTWIY
jgi:hypothetical protein